MPETPLPFVIRCRKCRVGNTKKIDTFNESDDGRDERPAKNQIKDPQHNVCPSAKVKAMSSQATETKCENTCCRAILSGPVYIWLAYSALRAHFGTNVDRASAGKAKCLIATRDRRAISRGCDRFCTSDLGYVTGCRPIRHPFFPDEVRFCDRAIRKQLAEFEQRYRTVLLFANGVVPCWFYRR